MNEVALVPEPTALAPVDVLASPPAVQPSAGVLCPCCGTPLPDGIRANRVYCNTSCQITFNNKTRWKERKARYYEKLASEPDRLLKQKLVRKAYYERTKHRQIQCAIEWNKRNPDRVKNAMRTWYHKNGKAYKLKNATKIRIAQALRTKNDRKKNPNKYRIIDGRHYAKRKFLCGFDEIEQAKISKWENSWRSKKKVRCYWCENMFKPDDCHKDHIKALSIGGEHKIGNLCISCLVCNCRKQAKSLNEWNRHIYQPVLI